MWPHRSYFRDRQEAGQQLAAALPPLEGSETVVIALPRGGVPVAEEICKALKAPMDLVFVRKIGAPSQPEVAMGAIVDGTAPHVVVNERIARAFGMDHAQVEAMGRELLPEIEHRRKTYLGDRAPVSLTGKVLVVVDDGVATGATLRAGLAALREVGAARVILALPVAPPDTLATFEGLADEIICLQTPDPFMAVGAAYVNFSQTSDEEVVAAMTRCAVWIRDEPPDGPPHE
ncbi:MAG: phosphoribosyltransferase [Litoreibacter sp.]|nr:phosphoribosyltransferase [Litoreibacter sp.]